MVVHDNRVQFILAQFPHRQMIDRDFPCFLDHGMCFVVGRLSELDQLRHHVKLDNNLPRPLYPILIKDCGLTDLPAKWLMLDKDGLWMMEGGMVWGKATEKEVPGFIPTSFIVQEDCPACLMGIVPCPFHILWP